MSVASKNLFELLGNDAEDDTPQAPVKTVEKTTMRSTKRGVEPEAPTRAAGNIGAARRTNVSGNEAGKSTPSSIAALEGADSALTRLPVRPSPRPRPRMPRPRPLLPLSPRSLRTSTSPTPITSLSRPRRSLLLSRPLSSARPTRAPSSRRSGPTPKRSAAKTMRPS
ncbi:hypothetical protein LX36DRAFT_236907 [Colletotrichum falcatum]|nr:hypothetical protein LX36DRAFT_236907 [Colletotrichum falcatum]